MDNQTSLAELGFDKSLYRASPIVNTFNDAGSVFGDSSGGTIQNPITEGTPSTQVYSGELAKILFYGKTSFTDTTAGYRQGVDTDGIYKWIIGDANSSIDWAVTAANTLTIIGSISATSGSIGGFTIGATDLSATSGGNTTTISSGTTAFSAGPTGSPTVTITQGGDLTATSATIAGSLSSQVTVTAGEALLIGDHLGFTSADTVKRYSPLTLPSADGNTIDQSASLAQNLVYDSTIQNGILLKVSTENYLHVSNFIFFHYVNEGAGTIYTAMLKIPVTLTTGAIGTISYLGGVACTGSSTSVHSIDMVAAGEDKVICVSVLSNTITASAVTTSGALTEGAQKTIDTTDCDYAFCEYISDSHVLFLYQDTAAATIVFSKKTLSGTTLTDSATGTVCDPAGTFTFRGCRRFPGTNYILLVVQNDTDGSAQVAVTTYDTGSSTFSATSAWVNFPGNIDISAAAGANVSFAPLSATQMILTFATSNTNINSMLVTISGTTPSCSAVVSTTRGTVSGFSITAVNARSAIQATINATTMTYKLLEVDSTGAALTTRASITDTSAAASGTLESNSIGAAWQVNPMRMGVVNYIGASNDPAAGSGLCTFPPPVGIAKATTAQAASLSAVVAGSANSLVSLTATQKYYADWAGLLTTIGNGTPDKVGVTKDTDELILKSW